MDSSGSIGSLRGQRHSTEISSDELIEDSDGEEQSVNDRQSLPSSKAVAVLSTSNRPAKLEAIDADNEIDETELLLTDFRPFSELPMEVIQVYEAMCAVDNNVSSKYNAMKARARVNDNVARDRKFLKTKVDKGKNPEMLGQYTTLKGARHSQSELECYLPTDSEFRHLLFAPTGGIRDTKTGLHAELTSVKINGKNQFLLCFPGTGVAGNLDRQWKNNLGQALGNSGPPRVFKQALALATALKAELDHSNQQLSVAGHSIGGGIANFVGLSLNIDSYCFNAAALGAGTLKQLDAAKCLNQEHIGKQHHVRLKGDFASRSGISNAIGSLPGSGRSRPRQIGKVYQITHQDAGFPHQGDLMERHRLDGMAAPMRAQKMHLQEHATENMPATNVDGTDDSPQTTASTSTTPVSSGSPPASTAGADPAEPEKSES